MSVIDEQAVLILGAGVSAPFHLPLGGHLIDDICLELAREHDEFRAADISSYRYVQHLKNIATSTTGFERFPIRAAVARQWLIDEESGFQGKELDEDYQRLQELQNLLNGQTSETIDDFIVENPQLARVTKIAIAVQLFLASYHFDNNRDAFVSRSFHDRKIWNTDERNWIHLLINMIRQGIRLNTVSEANPVKIITFNYDSVLERVLELQFGNTGVEYPHWSTFIEVLHVHGCCGKIEDRSVEPAAKCVEWAKEISVVNEAEPSKDILSVRTRARDLVQNAAKIYAVGFAFARPNVEMLGLNSSNCEEIELSYCNWDGNAGLTNAVLRIESELETQREFHINNPISRVTLQEATGDRAVKLSVSDWFRAGYPGGLPG